MQYPEYYGKVAPVPVAPFVARASPAGRQAHQA